MSNIYDEMAAQQFTVKEIESMVSRLTYSFADLRIEAARRKNAGEVLAEQRTSPFPTQKTFRTTTPCK